jgi:NADH:ubiquinone oxidoreductase subunit 4 (subunit M)
MAHVEAPTFGSIILAGVLLKLGGAGILRFIYLFDFSLLRYYVCGYSIVFLSFSTLVCCAQSDFKRLIAYSSVNHIIALLPLFLINTVSSDHTATLLMVLHGLSSPLLFFLVGLVYELFSTRQLVLLRGMCSVSPLLTLAITFGFFFNIRAPPFPSFIPEVLFFAISVGISPYFVPRLLFFALLSMVYNLN